MPDGECSSVQAMKPPETHPVSDRGFAKSQGLQLLATHHPVLLLGKFGERSL